MSLIEALIFGIVQGLTEFLPISSTAHIVITSIILDQHFENLSFEIFLHLASLFAIIIYFRNDLKKVLAGFFAYFKHKTAENKIHFRFGLYIIVATLITGILGLILTDFIDESLKTPPVIAFSLVITGAFLIFIERFRTYGSLDERTMGWRQTIIVALAQTLAVIPGVSRSGATLVAGLWSGLSRETAVRFSFLLAIPVIMGSSVLMLDDLTSAMINEIGVPALLVAFIASFIFSMIGIIWLIEFLKKSKLIYFAIYCFLLAFFVYFFLDHSIIIDVK